MFAIFCRRRLRVPRNDSSIFVALHFWATQNAAVLVRSCSSSVRENASEKTFTVSYLINSCRLSSKDAVSVSKKLCCIKSPEKPDAVLKLLREYGFTDAHISRLVIRWPKVLLACPNKTLFPKLEFLRSIGVPLPVLAQKLSVCPLVLQRSLKNSIIPSYNDLKTLLQSDERVVHVFTRAPRVICWCWAKMFTNVSMLRERGVPQSVIVSLIMRQPCVLLTNEEKLAVHVDRAVEMGFDVSRSTFVHAIHMFAGLSESTLKRKMEVYRRCGWSESDVIAAFLKHPICMGLSEKNITATMDFLVDALGCKPGAIAQCPVPLSYSLEKRIKPRCLVAGILIEKGLLKKRTLRMLKISEEEFLERYIVKYEKDIPELLDIYRGKVFVTLLSNWKSEQNALSFSVLRDYYVILGLVNGLLTIVVTRPWSSTRDINRCGTNDANACTWPGRLLSTGRFSFAGRDRSLLSSQMFWCSSVTILP
ncbi:hypothetical protein PHJA_000707500 [Phtheirospermum japonicum]|uniref:Mitochondrial transcription termination factor n=1 Tax=Phtheirospermum japonicum TaxID=374723 RepID=A0A830BKP2_9LAMI|nr:hypothetical protein PHJA_000707500 [Phtheirospermum japonicum]